MTLRVVKWCGATSFCGKKLPHVKGPQGPRVPSVLPSVECRPKTPTTGKLPGSACPTSLLCQPLARKRLLRACIVFDGEWRALTHPCAVQLTSRSKQKDNSVTSDIVMKKSAVHDNPYHNPASLRQCNASRWCTGVRQGGCARGCGKITQANGQRTDYSESD